MMTLSLIAVAVSSAILVLLCLRDPKRMRSVRLKGAPQGTGTRRILTAASLLPGLALAVNGNAAAFLIWLGGYAVVGWLVTLSFSSVQDGASRG